MRKMTKFWGFEKFDEGLQLIVDKKNLGIVRDICGSSTAGFVKVSPQNCHDSTLLVFHDVLQALHVTFFCHLLLGKVKTRSC